MIPQRIKLRGFLCYKDEQDISFHDRSLWMLAGNNGSGKSTVFDAVTYALFGHHRGGSQHAGDLINKDSTSLAVEFEFLLDGQHYRIRRTLQRNQRGVTGTQLIARHRGGQNGSARWEPLEDTSRKANFETWVRDNIGLDYETFTSSVLLLQGKAEKLLDSTAKGRFEVLAGIVDLEHYEKLHRLADEERKAHEGALKNLKERRDALPEVTAEALEQAGKRIEEAETARQQAQEEVERCQALIFQARAWAELQTRLAETRQRWTQAEGLLAESKTIEEGLNRLHDLRAALPNVQAAHEQRQQLQDSERRTAELTKQKETLTTQLTQQEHALDQTRRKRTALQQLIQADEQRRKEAAGQFRLAAVLLEKVKGYERQENELARVRAELARLPASLADELRQARATCDELVGLAATVPVLARLHGHREELRQVRGRAETAEQARQSIQTRGSTLASEVERLRPSLDEASRSRQQADSEATRAHTLLEQATQGLAEIDQLQGAKLCRHCGQELTPGHVKEEKRRRQSEVADAKKRLREAGALQRSAQDAERQKREQLTGLDQQLQAAREEYVSQKHQAEQARKDIERLQRECATAFGELSDAFRAKVSPTASEDWLTTSFPTEADLAALRGQAAGLTAARQRVRQAEEAQEQRNQLLAQETAFAQTLVRLQAELPKDVQRVRQDHARLEAEEQALERSLTARRAEDVEIHKQLERLTRERETTQRALADLSGKVGTEERTRQHIGQALDRALGQLSAPWRTALEGAGLSRLYGWIQERDQLQERGLEARWNELQQARLSLEMLRQELANLEKQQEQFPAEARAEPTLLQGRLTQTRQAQKACDDELAAAQQHRLLLQGHDRQRQELAAEILHLEKEHNNTKILATLLGRDRLQLHLVRQAERQVVDYANAVLDRLSGGQLHLRLVGEAGGDGTAAKALELEAYNRATGERPINVAFLSGSQKFRVAVSLALGIGQYASRQHRPIESVIIDEGFGCLDREGRQVMIQELQNLRGHLRCILLVSHQEDFASAFADGYRFELAEGTTRVTRFQQ